MHVTRFAASWALLMLIGMCRTNGDDAALAKPAETSVRAEAPNNSTQFRLLADQRYCGEEGPFGLCDIYSPVSPPPPSGYPIVLVIHGGGWISGDKWMQQSYAGLLAAGGFVAVSINYRLAPDHKFPAQVDDVREALLWTKRNAKKLSLDLDRLGIYGYSAGGHLSALAATLADEPIAVRAAASNWSATDARWEQLPTIHAVCAGGPPCDFRSLPLDNTVMAYFLGGSRREKPDAYIAASPNAHVSSSDPVTQIIHGEHDLLVPVAASRRFHQSQIDAGIDSRVDVVAGKGHMLTFLDPNTGKKVVDFFTEVLAPAASASSNAKSENLVD